MRTPAKVVHVELEGQPRAARHARAALRELCGDGYVDLVDYAEVVLTELVVNAVEHGSPPIRCDLECSTDGIRLQVSDAGSDVPVCREVSLLDDSGRGMALVDELSDDWGVDTGECGKTVWVRMTTAPVRPGG